MTAHGTVSSYNNHACRCPHCRKAARDYNRERRTRLSQAPGKQIPHGTRNGYITYSCRCDRCRQANRDYLAAYEAERRTA
jgi:hypothetical protein